MLAGRGAAAAELRDFDSGSFERARQAGRLVVLVVSSGRSAADADLPQLVEALSDGDLAGDAVFFRLDFHRQRNQLARFKIDREGTIIVYRGRQERGRSVGEADGITLRRLIEGAK